MIPKTMGGLEQQQVANYYIWMNGWLIERISAIMDK